MEEYRDLISSKIGDLSSSELSVVELYINAILQDIHAESVAENSWIASTEWLDAFTARLKAHHALSTEPLSREQFEAAFQKACEADGWEVEAAESATQRFFDIKISKGDIKKSISLKATAAKDIKPHTLHISKLSEAAWIQDTRRQVDRRDAIVNLFREFRECTDSIIMLRCFRYDGPPKYEIVEIPTSLFAQLDDLDVASAQKNSIPLPIGSKKPSLVIALDRSDAKITVRKVDINVCTIHGQWQFPREGT